MSRLAAFSRFWWGFVVGDDWVAAAGVVLALVATGVVAAAHVAAWWLMPLAVIVVLGVSLQRATR